jgi:competence protein ComEA
VRRLLARARAALAAAVLLAGAGLATATWIHSGPAAAERAPSTAEAARDPPAPPGRAIDPRERKEPCPPARGRVLRGKVNLNTATSEELVLLPGVGPALAKRILEWRERRGNFRRVRDLRRVRGFGPKTLAKLGPYLTVDEETSLRVE